ncbi:MAG: hypothetical protein AAFX08_11625 [Pseudomonadota bacterium]
MPRVRERSPMFWRYAIIGMVAGVFGLFALAAFNRPPATDVLTACRVDRNDPAHTIILIDQSDPFNSRDIGWVRSFVDAEARLLPKYGRLTVVTPNSAQPYEPNEVFFACSPGSSEKANPILQNPQMIEDTWREKFYEPLKVQVEQALNDTEAATSPLSEAIFAVFDRPDFQKSMPDRRLVIVSDLMQNSDAFSFYRSGADMAAFQETRLASERPDMSGADVVARIVPRQEYDLPIDTVEDFWSEYFRGGGAVYASVN